MRFRFYLLSAAAGALGLAQPHALSTSVAACTDCGCNKGVCTNCQCPEEPSQTSYPQPPPPDQPPPEQPPPEQPPPEQPAPQSYEPAPQAATDTGTDVDPSSFYQPLSAYGQWINIAGQGRCFCPANVGPNWQPYTVGCWQYTNCGLTWISNEPFGWACCHYGGWFNEPTHGWCWKPGPKWAPAWCGWRSGGGCIGWAPLPPDHGTNVYVNIVDRIPANNWSFCHERDICQQNIRQHCLPVSQNTTIIRRTTNITNVKVVNRTVVNQSINIQKVRQVTGQRIEPKVIRTVDHPSKAVVRGNAVNMYVPPARTAQRRTDVRQGAQTTPPRTATAEQLAREQAARQHAQQLQREQAAQQFQRGHNAPQQQPQQLHNGTRPPYQQPQQLHNGTRPPQQQPQYQGAPRPPQQHNPQQLQQHQAAQQQLARQQAAQQQAAREQAAREQIRQLQRAQQQHNAQQQQQPQRNSRPPQQSPQQAQHQQQVQHQEQVQREQQLQREQAAHQQGR